MLRIYPRDLIAFKYQDSYYYTILLDKIRLFGGQLSYCFYFSSKELCDSDALLKKNRPGFHAIVDYIWTKRENRIFRLARKVDIESYLPPPFFKQTLHPTGKAQNWWIYDSDGNEVNMVARLTDEMAKYPLFSRIDDSILVELINQRWCPAKDERI